MRTPAGADVLIIGGGINGAGTFRDLALQGVDVTLVERGDYCQGASGASSHMIHGGLRYLENGEFRLVRESVHERNRLLKIAPHYVRPLATTIPIFSTFSGMIAAPLRLLTHKPGTKPRPRGAVLIRIGLGLYDSFSRQGGGLPRHRFAGRARTRRELPDLNSAVRYSATYFDASVHNPERLNLDLVRDGLAAHPGARAVNYVSAAGSTQGGVTLGDELTGETTEFDARVIVNATGAWVDQTNEALGVPTQFMGGTKGSHIVLDHPGLLAACAGREILFEHTDGRIALIYPIEDRVLVGTTDIETTMEEPAVCTEEEVEYFFALIAHVFPEIRVTRHDIIYRFSGVRPLPRHGDLQPGFVSRDYRIERSERRPGGSDRIATLSLVGGKWTTFRSSAEHLTNEVLAILGRDRRVSTAGLPIGGGVDFPASASDLEAWVASRTSKKTPARRVRALLHRYGTRASEVIDFLEAGNDTSFVTTDELSVREVEYMAAREQVGRLIDIPVRRTSLAFRGLINTALIEELAEALGPHLGWDGIIKTAEIAHANAVLAEARGGRSEPGTDGRLHDAPPGNHQSMVQPPRRD